MTTMRRRAIGWLEALAMAVLLAIAVWAVVAPAQGDTAVPMGQGANRE